MNYIYLLGFLLLNLSTFAQYCTSVGPTSTVDSNVESVILNGVVGAINYTGCPGVVGLEDLTQNVSVTLNAGGNYTLTVQFGTCQGNYSGAGEAWIDFDQNGSFDPYESIGTWTGIPPAIVQNWMFNVPSGATNGVTRLRVMQREAGTIPLNPCATYAWGSVTDFGIIITNGLDCTGYIGDDENDAIVVDQLPFSDSRSTEICYSNHNYVYPSPDIYYYFEPNPLMEQVNVSVCGANFDTFLSVVDLNGNVVAYNDDYEECAPQSALSFDAANLGPVYIIVEGWGIFSGDYTIQINSSYVGLQDSDTHHNLVFPNPSSGDLKLFANTGAYQLTDINGKLISHLNSDEQDVYNFQQLMPGVYFIKSLQTGQVQKWEKL